MQLSQLVEYLDEYLRTADVPDYPAAHNGLQVAGERDVRRIAVAVDASERAIQEAAKRSCDLLLVHHGLFWDEGIPLTGRRYRKIKALIQSGMAVYSSHIPLDLHPEVGNSAVLARALGIEIEGMFGRFKGVDIGVWGTLELKRETLAARLDELLGQRVRLIPGGPDKVWRVGVITGAGGGMLSAALDARLDALVTGEGAHHTYFEAMENGINLYYGGHYATEVWGVRALAAHIQEKFSILYEFIDVPSGM